MKLELSENTSYKVVALFVTLVLWLTMLSRKDAVMTRQMRLHVLIPSRMQLHSTTPENVVIKLSGPRLVLQKYSDSEDELVLDLTRMPPGHSRIHLTQANLSLPLGVRILAIDPEDLVVDLRQQLDSHLKGTSE